MDPTERSFAGPALARAAVGSWVTGLMRGGFNLHAVWALLHTLEGFNERLVCDAYGLDEGDVKAVLDETGTPAGWYPLLEGFDRLEFAAQPPQEAMKVLERFAEQIEALPRKCLSSEDTQRLKERARALYLAEVGAGPAPVKEAATDGDGEAALGAYIPIPAESVVESLAQKLQLHPICVAMLLRRVHSDDQQLYWTAMRRHTEDYFSVILLRLLGYRWPEHTGGELSFGRDIPEGAIAPDGILPLVPIAGLATAAERVRAVEIGEGEDHGWDESAQLALGRELSQWLRRDFFKRPIAWHLVSPERTFEALVLYHKLSKETLQALRTNYAGKLIAQLQAERERARERKAASEAGLLQAQIEDVEAFRQELERIERGDDLVARIRCRWKGEEDQGRPGPYTPDIDDGVKVNIRPFQEAGLLAMKEVIKKW